MDNLPKILVVDDENNILRAIKRLLSPYNLRVFTTTSSTEALEIIANYHIDLIISDQRMPTMEGIEILKQAKDISPSTIRILLSGYSDIEVFIAAINNGSISRYISKPWENEELIKLILDTINSKSLEDEKEKLFTHLFKDKNQWNEFMNQTKIVRRSELINSIIHDRSLVTTSLIDEAKTLDVNLEAPIYCCLLTIRRSLSKEIHEKKDLYRDSNLKYEVIFLLSTIPNCLAWDCNGLIGVIFQNKMNGETYNVIDDMNSILNNYYSNLYFKIGVSKINSGTDSVIKSYRQAKGALLIAEKSNTVKNISYFHEIGVYQLLTIANEDAISSDFVKENLGKLIEYDDAKGGDYVRTLEGLLRYANLKEAAADLFIHPKTLVFRRKRIEEILGIDLDIYETRLSLAIAIKMYRLK